MLKLLLLRHAKSSWNDPDHSDQQRPLNKRGIAAAPQMGSYIAKHNLTPTLILSSTATRARQTTQFVSEQFSDEIETRFIEDLYSFSGYPGALNIIRNNGDQQSPLMVVGHNPTLEELADELIAAGNSTARAVMNQKYPSAGLAIIDFNVTKWADIQTSMGILVDFIRPKDL